LWPGSDLRRRIPHVRFLGESRYAYERGRSPRMTPGDPGKIGLLRRQNSSLTYLSETNSPVICDFAIWRNIADGAGLCLDRVGTGHSCVPQDIDRRRRMMKRVLLLVAAASLAAATTSAGYARGGGASGFAPGTSFRAHGSVAGHPGASGYAPGHLFRAHSSVRGHPGASGFAPGHRFTHHMRLTHHMTHHAHHMRLAHR